MGLLLDHRGQSERRCGVKAQYRSFLAISETGGAELADALDMFVFMKTFISLICMNLSVSTPRGT